MLRKTTPLGFREDELAVDQHVELPPGADFDLDFLAEALLDGGGQTDRARPISSSLAIENFNRHD